MALQVVLNIIRPATAEFQCAWTVLPDHHVIGKIREEEIGPPRMFISHTWANPWGLLVSALKDLAEMHSLPSLVHLPDTCLTLA